MKFKNKILILFILIVITAVSIVIFSFNKIFDEGREEYLTYFAQNKITIVNNYFEYSSKELENRVLDNAYWNDFYYNLEEKNAEWIQQNVTEYLYNVEDFYIDIVFLENNNGDFNEIYGENVTIEDIKSTDVYKKTIIENEFNQEYIEINNHVYIIVGCPVSIYNSEDSNGILILAREINKEFLLQLQKFLLYDDINEIKFINNNQDNTYIMNNNNNVDIYYSVQNQNDKNLLWLKLNFNTKLINNLISKILVRIIYMILICALGATVIFYIVFKNNMNNIDIVLQQIKKISQGNYDIKLLEKGDYEFKELIRSVNKMSSNIKNFIEEQEKTYFEAIRSLVVTIEMKDPYTRGHSERVAYYAYYLGKELNFEEVDDLYNAALVHDIGKISITNNILNKPGKLTDEEYELIKGHTINGFKILEASRMYSNIKYIIRYHHERIDGKGYPDGLINTNIPFGARILSVADVFDALTSERSYRKPMGIKDAIQVIVNGKNTQFDSKVIDVFEKNIYKIYHNGIKAEFKIDY